MVKIDIITKIFGDCWWILESGVSDKRDELYEKLVQSLLYAQGRFDWYKSELAEQLYELNEKIPHVVTMKDWLHHAKQVGYLHGLYVEHLRCKAEKDQPEFMSLLSELQSKEKSGASKEECKAIKEKIDKYLHEYHELLKSLYVAIRNFNKFIDAEYSVDEIFAYDETC